MKVTRTGSREPQTLARLQHTHIVPVYSYRTDPATGLHLLCMPYLGRLTLARVLGDPAIQSARSGADLALLLDRLQTPDGGANEGLIAPAAGSRALTERTYARAIAWWGARLAEALQHAHDRGVLHRDVKPSNILVTDDGLPMLLDFNLAQEPWIDDPDAARATLGGTLAYMAPEQLEALAKGSAEWVDARSDLYALGVVLYECLVRGSRTFALPTGVKNLTEAMRSRGGAAAGQAPAGAGDASRRPRGLRGGGHALPGRRPGPALCLGVGAGARPPGGGRRRPAPLRPRAAGQPLRPLAPPQPAAAGAGRAAAAWRCWFPRWALVGAQMAELRMIAEVEHRIQGGKHLIEDDHPDLAESAFDDAARLAASGSGADLRRLHDQAVEEGRRARAAKEIRAQADDLFKSRGAPAVRSARFRR